MNICGNHSFISLLLQTKSLGLLKSSKWLFPVIPVWVFYVGNKDQDSTENLSQLVALVIRIIIIFKLAFVL